MRFVLVHSPVVGPSTWQGVATALRERGHEAVAPDLRAAAERGDPQAFVDAAVAGAAGDEPAVVVGHSGAGFFLPFVAAGTTAPVRLTVFVDAGIPPCDGRSTPSADFLDRLRALAAAGPRPGVLPRWSAWWEEDVMAALVPDAARRAEVEAELPEVPLAFYEVPLTMPAGWCDTPGAYLLLSDAYRDDAGRARSLGWPVVERLGNHLDVVNRPADVAADLGALVPY